MRPTTRREAIGRILGATAVAPFGLRALVGNAGPVFAQEAPAVVEGAEPAAPVLEPGHFFYSLTDPANGPLGTGVTRNKWKVEMGYAGFENGVFVIHHHWGRGLTSREWISSRIGEFSIMDGALMVEARGDLNSIGCFALEMRHQAYKDHKYVRSNWLMIDPPSGKVELQTDGYWDDMTLVAGAQMPDVVRPLHEWNRLLFIAQGFHFQGWVNGVKVTEGDNTRFGRGRIALVAARMNEAPFRTEFRNLHVWDGVVPDPAAVWG